MSPGIMLQSRSWIAAFAAACVFCATATPVSEGVAAHNAVDFLQGSMPVTEIINGFAVRDNVYTPGLYFRLKAF